MGKEEERLRQFLTGAAKVLVLGIGSELKKDDAVGVLLARWLKERAFPGLTVLEGGNAPENLSGEIKRLAPSHLLLVDAAEMKEEPGTVRFLGLEELGGFSFSTHALPLHLFVSFLRVELPDLKVAVLGIQPEFVGFGEGLSPAAAAGLAEAGRWLADIFKK
jgi:hydrogenase 3 maturation protease